MQLRSTPDGCRGDSLLPVSAAFWLSLLEELQWRATPAFLPSKQSWLRCWFKDIGSFPPLPLLFSGAWVGELPNSLCPVSRDFHVVSILELFFWHQIHLIIANESLSYFRFLSLWSRTKYFSWTASKACVTTMSLWTNTQSHSHQEFQNVPTTKNASLKQLYIVHCFIKASPLPILSNNWEPGQPPERRRFVVMAAVVIPIINSCSFWLLKALWQIHTRPFTSSIIRTCDP